MLDEITKREINPKTTNKMRYYCKQCKKNQNFKQVIDKKKGYPLKAGIEHFVIKCNVCGWRWFTSNKDCLTKKEIKERNLINGRLQKWKK